IPHCDGAGVIVAVGPDGPADRIGQRVWLWNAQGGYGSVGRPFGTAAAYIALPEDQAVHLSDHYTMEEGACLGVPAMTAHRCVLADGPLADQTVLVQGGAGAVGSLAVQIGVLARARVLATVSSQTAADRITELGAEPILRHDTDVAERVLAMTHGDGVDRVVEVDFAANAAVDAAVLKPNGVLASYSSSSNPMPTLDYYAFAAKGQTVRFVQGFALPPAARTAGHRFLADHRLDIAIGTVLPLDRIAEAHDRVESGGHVGQTVLSI
ncbi:MAG: zinc-binding dehydrogenase, partial [Pseudomonadota bacterium]